MLVVPKGHRLAGRMSVSPNDFAGEDFICPHGGARALYPTESYRPSDPGPTSEGPGGESFEDRLDLVASGEVLALLPVGDRRSSLRPDLVSVPVEGVPASEVVVATRRQEPNPLVAAFVAAARTELAAQSSSSFFGSSSESSSSESSSVSSDLAGADRVAPPTSMTAQ